MEKIICAAILILYGLVMLAMCYIAIFPKGKKPKNNVHFYVEMSGRDKELKLYIQTVHGYKLMIAGQSEFKWFGLNPQDFDFIEEYKPIEVFLNIKN